MSGPPWADDAWPGAPGHAAGAGQDGVEHAGRDRSGRGEAGRARMGRGGDVAGPTGTVDLPINIGRVQITLWLLVGALVSLNFLVSVTAGLRLLPYTVTRFFDGNDDASLLSGTKTTLLLLSVLLMAGCAAAGRWRGDPSAGSWRLLAIVTGFVFADETTQLRSSLAEVLRDRYRLHGVERYAWAVLYIPVAAVVAVVLIRELRRMAPGVRNRLVPGVVLYAVGAIVLEPFQARLAEEHGDDTLSFKFLAAVCESAQLLGITLLFCAVLVAASRLAQGFRFVLTSSEPDLDAVRRRRRAAGGDAAPEWAPAQASRRTPPAVDPAPEDPFRTPGVTGDRASRRTLTRFGRRSTQAGPRS